MRARRSEREPDGLWCRPWLLAVGPTILALTAGLAGATTFAFRSERAIAAHDIVAAVSKSVATAHSPDGAQAAVARSSPW
jgi:hypothetical protein